MGSRTEYWDDPQAPVPNSLVPACGVLALDDEGRLLLQRRRDTGQWALPMGQMELGESPSACAVRETLEETGVLVRPGVQAEVHHTIVYLIPPAQAAVCLSSVSSDSSRICW